MITKENEKIAVDCLKEVLLLIHEKRYDELNTVVDKIEYDGLIEVLKFLEETVYPYEIDCFNPEIQYYIYEMKDESGFRVDYPLTSCGTEISAILFMEFKYSDKGLVKIINTVDAD